MEFYENTDMVSPLPIPVTASFPHQRIAIRSLGCDGLPLVYFPELSFI